MASSNRCTPGTAKTATTAVSAPFPTGDHFPLVKIDGASRESRRAVDLWPQVPGFFTAPRRFLSTGFRPGAKGPAEAVRR